MFNKIKNIKKREKNGRRHIKGRKEENSIELQKPNVEIGLYNNNNKEKKTHKLN